MAEPPQIGNLNAAVAQPQSSSMASTTEPNHNKKYDPKKRHITEEPMTATNWFKHINWLNVTLTILVPIYGMVMAYYTPLQWKTAA